LPAHCCPASRITEDFSSRPKSLVEKRVQQVFNPNKKNEFLLGFFQRVDSFPDYSKAFEERKRKAATTDRLFLFGCAFAVFLFLMPFCIGVGVLLAPFFSGR
jgi:hypothetical protein